MTQPTPRVRPVSPLLGLCAAGLLTTTPALGASGGSMTQPAETTAAPEHTNALIHESSPYLLQHAHNPDRKSVV